MPSSAPHPEGGGGALEGTATPNVKVIQGLRNKSQTSYKYPLLSPPQLLSLSNLNPSLLITFRQFVHKAEEALTGKTDKSHDSTESSSHGPHSSNLANKLDPRVDSDHDNRAAHAGVDDKHFGTCE
ncbi:unnamed protein product [Penicillium palitans]